MSRIERIGKGRLMAKVEHVTCNCRDGFAPATPAAVVFCSLHNEAPELLAELEEVARVLVEMFAGNIPAYHQERIDRARAVISRAKGES